MTELLGLVGSNTQKEMNMTENGSMTRLMAMEFKRMAKIIQPTKDTGKMTSSMGMDLKRGKMGLFTVDSTGTVLNTVKESLIGMMAVVKWVTLLIITLKVKEFTNGKTVDATKDLGLIIELKVMVFLPGLMEEFKKVIKRMIKNMDLGNFFGKTDESILGIGKMGNNMEKELCTKITL